MFPRLPQAITSLVFLFLLATPTIASPLSDNSPAPAQNEAPTKLQPRQASQPSRRMGQRRSKKPEPIKQKDYSSFLCPGGSVACPVPPENAADITPESAAALGESLSTLADWFKIGFECIELATELNSCGGCLALGQGQDCSTTANARATGCDEGQCQVYSCFDGYVVTPDRKACVKKGSVVPATPVTAFTQLVMEEVPLF